MSNIVKMCKCHGLLLPENIYIRPSTKRTDCKICLRLKRTKTKDKQKMYWQKYYAKNKEQIYKKNYINAPKYELRSIKILDDNYIKRLLCKSSKLKINRNSIPAELIELKRAIVLVKRKLRDENDSN